MDDNPAMTLLLSGIQSSLRDVTAGIDGIRKDLQGKADANDVRELFRRIGDLEAAIEASSAVDDAVNAGRNSRRAIVIAACMTALTFAFNVIYWTLIKK